MRLLRLCLRMPFNVRMDQPEQKAAAASLLAVALLGLFLLLQGLFRLLLSLVQKSDVGKRDERANQLRDVCLLFSKSKIGQE